MSETNFGKWKPFKNDEKCFLISSQKLFLFSRYLSFCFDFLVTYRNGLIKKISLISNFGYQTVVIHILPNISRSKCNQAMQFGQLIEWNMRNIFLEKSYTKCSGETSPKPFSEKLKLNIFLNQQSKNLYSLFLLDGKFRAIEIYWNLAADHLLSPDIKLFLKKKRPETSLNFYFSGFILIIDQISLSGYLDFARYWVICVLKLFVNQVVTSWILKLTLSF